MARTVRWTETATTDLEEVVAFIATDSRFYAAALVREARQAVWFDFSISICTVAFA